MKTQAIQFKNTLLIYVLNYDKKTNMYFTKFDDMQILSSSKNGLKNTVKAYCEIYGV